MHSHRIKAISSIWMILFLSCLLIDAEDSNSVTSAIALTEKNLQPIIRFSANFTVEEKLPDGKWGNLRSCLIIRDFATDKQYDEQVMDVSPQSRLHRIEVWNGERSTNYDYFDKAPVGTFANLSQIEATGTNGCATIARDKPYRPNPILQIRENRYSRGPSTLEYLRNIKNLKLVREVEDGKRRLFIFNVSPSCDFTVDGASGCIIENRSYIGDALGRCVLNVLVKGEEIVHVGELFVPKKITVFSTDTEDGKLSTERYSFSAASIKVNEEIRSELFGLKLPIGSLVTDTIQNKVYKVTDLEDVRTAH